MSAEVCKRCDGQGWIWDHWVERRVDCEPCRRTGMVPRLEVRVLDRLREMFGIEVTDVDGVFAALEAYDKHMHRWVEDLRTKVNELDEAVREMSPAYAPWGCINVITEADGHESCNHSDAVACSRTGHVTESLYRRVAAPSEPGGES